MLESNTEILTEIPMKKKSEGAEMEKTTEEKRRSFEERKTKNSF
jgi:hypothetical protein